MKPNLALVVGTGRTMWDDFFQAPLSATVFAVNHAVSFLPRVQHAVSAHAAVIGGLALSRLGRRINKRDALAVHSIAPAPGVTMVWDERVFEWAGLGGTSSLLAVRIALRLGFDTIWLAGVPLDTKGHVYDPEHYAYATDFTDDIAPWLKLIDEHPRVEIRSYSGVTRDLFGAPGEA